MTTSVIPTLTQVEQNFLSLVLIPGVQGLIGSVAFFSTPVIGPVLGWLASTLATFLVTWGYGYATLFIDTTTIQLKNVAHQSAYEAQSEVLISIANQNGVNSTQYAQAEATALADLSQFTRFNT